MKESVRNWRECEESRRSQCHCGQSSPPLRARRAMATAEQRSGDMVWHIFKKDWKLLWTFVLMAALLHWMSVLVFYRRGLFSDDVTLEMLSQYLPILAFFGSMFLI